MLNSIESYLRYFEEIHQRTLRDVEALPPQANGWAPPSGEGEAGWDVNRVIAHIATTRRYFVRAYRGEGWLSPEEPDASDSARWPALIEESAEAVREGLAGTPQEWLERDIRRLGSEELLSGWRVLMTLVEHEVHHRSQLDTYAGINGWEPPQIYGRRWEQVLDLQQAERETQEGGR